MGLDDFKHSCQLRTVCEVTREIFDLINTNRQQLGEVLYAEIFTKLQEQMRMQKKMDARLRKYKSDYASEIFETNVNFQDDEARRSGANL